MSMMDAVRGRAAQVIASAALLELSFTAGCSTKQPDPVAVPVQADLPATFEETPVVAELDEFPDELAQNLEADEFFEEDTVALSSDQRRALLKIEQSLTIIDGRQIARLDFEDQPSAYQFSLEGTLIRFSAQTGYTATVEGTDPQTNARVIFVQDEMRCRKLYAQVESLHREALDVVNQELWTMSSQLVDRLTASTAPWTLRKEENTSTLTAIIDNIEVVLTKKDVGRAFGEKISHYSMELKPADSTIASLSVDPFGRQADEVRRAFAIALEKVQ